MLKVYGVEKTLETLSEQTTFMVVWALLTKGEEFVCLDKPGNAYEALERGLLQANKKISDIALMANDRSLPIMMAYVIRIQEGKLLLDDEWLCPDFTSGKCPPITVLIDTLTRLFAQAVRPESLEDYLLQLYES